MGKLTSEALSKKLEKSLRSKMAPVFRKYGLAIEPLLTPLRWKPLVLVIGNYSSGKSTLINELLGQHIQRTGQAPTDDSFTIITHADDGDGRKEISGNTIINDESLPFTPLRRFGERLLSHLRLKQVNAPILHDLAIIDTPGMLDSVTERDRGYDYLSVVGELARISDIILLMFDPHKAGTIKETYQAIRSTLPGSTGEDRVFYVLNRIDECENVIDLVKSFGTLCWNLSQMTGRKDIPRIFLTFAATESSTRPGLEIWESEREELKQHVLTAPKMRINHLFEEVERGIREISLQVEALSAFRAGFSKRLKKIFRIGAITVLAVLLGGDLLLKLVTGYPESTFIWEFVKGSLKPEHLFIPGAAAFLVIIAFMILINKIAFPQYVKATLENLDTLLPLETKYKKDLWGRVKESIQQILTEKARRYIWINHDHYHKRIERFLERDLRKLFPGYE